MGPASYQTALPRAYIVPVFAKKSNFLRWVKFFAFILKFWYNSYMLKDSRRACLIALISANVLAWVSFLSIIFFTNPKSAGRLGIVVLDASFAIGLICLILFLWQLIKWKKN